MMINIKHIAATFALILGGVVMAGTAQASQTHASDKALMPVASHVQYAQFAQNRPGARANISYAQAKSIARSRVPGSQVVDIALIGQTYRVRLQTRDGRVVDVYVDAATGRVR